MTQYRFRDPAGRTLSLEGDFDTRLLLWQAECAVTTPMNGRAPDSLQTRSLSIAHASNHDEWLRETAEASLVGQYSMWGGSLEIWRPADARAQGLARWRGPHHAATAYLPFQQWEDHSFSLDYFADLAFDDSAIGLAVAPRSSSINVGVLDVSAVLQGVGLIEILSPDVGLSSVPSWKGMKVPSGEIWRVESSDDPEITSHLVLCSDSVVVTATPSARASMNDCLKFLAQIRSIGYEKGAA